MLTPEKGPTSFAVIVDWSGKNIQKGKRGFIDNDLPPILNRIGFEIDQWQTLVTDFEGRNKTIAGAAEVVRDKCHLFGKRWIHGIKGRHLLFA